MPKIQLSALATDMKGKSGGSVFARNKGGLYFRNNPKPVQKKSFQWEAQKAKFTALSTSWRALSNDERVAWEQAGVNYPGTDAWGNSYIPSGFQLYMRLNGTLKSYNLPLLSVPNAPGTWPENYQDIEWHSPTNNAFTPYKSASLTGNGAQNWYLYAKNYLQDVDIFGLTHMSMRFTISKNGAPFNPHGCVIRLNAMLDTSEQGMFSLISVDSNGRYILYVVYNYVNNLGGRISEVKQYDITTAYLSGQFHLTYYNDFKFVKDPKLPTTYSLNSRIYLDGFELLAISTRYNDGFENPYSSKAPGNGKPAKDISVMFKNKFTGTLRVGNYDKTSVRALNVSDIRFWDIQAMGISCPCEEGEECPENYECYRCECTLSYDGSVSFNDVKYRMIAHGYILGNESIMTPLNSFDKGIFPSYNTDTEIEMVFANDEDCCNGGSDCEDFSDQECRDCCCIYVGDSDWTTPRLDYTFTPLVFISSKGLVDTKFHLAVRITKPLGLGNSGFNAQYKTICTLPPWLTPIKKEARFVTPDNLNPIVIGDYTSDVSAPLRMYLKSVSDNTQIYLSFGIVNGDTGEIVNIDKKFYKCKNTIRFKAGSELSSSVN